MVRGVRDPEWVQEIRLANAPKISISMWLDADVLEWFRRLGPGYQTRINQALYREMTKEKAKRRPLGW